MHVQKPEKSRESWRQSMQTLSKTSCEGTVVQSRWDRIRNVVRFMSAQRYRKKLRMMTADLDQDSSIDSPAVSPEDVKTTSQSGQVLPITEEDQVSSQTYTVPSLDLTTYFVASTGREPFKRSV